ncbi:MAG TPA: HAD-IB family phosphatase [Candidatus Paceibacterota bacterium]|nr:HAD-IB family phosphatase [Candidatus Paceibacterota bacterium]
MAVSRSRKTAIFDIDGTIFRSSLLIELSEAMIGAGIWKPSVRKIYEKDRERWIARKGDYETYIRSVIRMFEGHIEGVRYADFLRVSSMVVESQQDRVYRFTRDLVRDLKKKNYYVLAISQSPWEAVREFGKRLGFSKVYGMVYELDQKKQRFNGNILHRDLILDKAAVLRRAVEVEGLSLKSSIGVGDTGSDIPFLKMVDRPICFNPNRALYRHARRAGWEIVVERKDVVYTI